MSERDFRKKVTANVHGKSLTQENFAKDADINNIVGRHLGARRGNNLSNIGQGGTRQPIFGDFSSIDYHEMLNKVTSIDSVFGRLPAKVRGRFRHRPELAIAFCEDKANLKEAVKMGLMVVPDGYSVSEEGDLMEQMDIEKEAVKPPEPASAAPKPDPEAQSHNGPKKA